MDEPREITFRGKRATLYTWRRSMHYPDRWQAAASGKFFTEGEMIHEWLVNRVWQVDGRAPHIHVNAMRYW